MPPARSGIGILRAFVGNVFCNSGGECSGGYIDEIYAKDSDGRFTRRLEPRLELLPMASRT